MNEPILKIETIKVCNLIDDYRSGLIVIPEFPREHVWTANRAPALLESRPSPGQRDRQKHALPRRIRLGNPMGNSP